jgi:hypothetical protein
MDSKKTEREFDKWFSEQEAELKVAWPEARFQEALRLFAKLAYYDATIRTMECALADFKLIAISTHGIS